MATVKREITEEEAYGWLMAAILQRAIADYVTSSQSRFTAKKEKIRRKHESIYFSCEEFFRDPWWEFEGIDLTEVRRLCEEAIKTGEKLPLQMDIKKLMNQSEMKERAKRKAK